MISFPWKYELSDHTCAIYAGELLSKYTDQPETPLQIEAVSDKILRIHTRTHPSFAVETPPDLTGTLKLSEKTDKSIDTIITKYQLTPDSSLFLSTPALHVILDKNLHLQIFSTDGTLLCSDYTGSLKEPASLTEEEIEQMRQEGHVVHTGEDSCRFQVVKSLMGDEIFYGLGDKTGFLNKKGYDYTMWNSDNPDPHVENPTFKALYKSIPGMQMRKMSRLL